MGGESNHESKLLLTQKSAGKSVFFFLLEGIDEKDADGNVGNVKDVANDQIWKGPLHLNYIK